MITHQLSFARVIKLDQDMAEVIVDDGVDVDVDHVEELHGWIRANLNNQCLILVNRLNDYSHVFEAQKQIATIDEIRALSVVAYSDFSRKNAQLVAQLPAQSRSRAVQVFDNRESALGWLETQRVGPPSSSVTVDQQQVRVTLEVKRR